jgi:Co/Zn/Cd efflux system component
LGHRTENRRVITMEWIFEGVALIFAGMLTAAVARVRDDGSTTPTAAYAALLIVATVISVRTAVRNTLIAYRLFATKHGHKRDTPAGCDSDSITLPPVNRGRRRRGRTCLTRQPRRHDFLPLVHPARLDHQSSPVPLDRWPTRSVATEPGGWGSHARSDAIVSAGVTVSAIAVALGAPIADPIIGLCITALILRITAESWNTVRGHHYHH